MSLLDVPVALWQSLLCKWVLLPDVIRFDFAVGSNKSAAANHLPLLLHDIQVSFCDNGKGNCKHLEKLSLWMKQRKVYFNHMEISAYSATDEHFSCCCRSYLLKYNECSHFCIAVLQKPGGNAFKFRYGLH